MSSIKEKIFNEWQQWRNLQSDPEAQAIFEICETLKFDLRSEADQIWHGSPRHDRAEKDHVFGCEIRYVENPTTPIRIVPRDTRPLRAQMDMPVF